MKCMLRSITLQGTLCVYLCMCECGLCMPAGMHVNGILWVFFLSCSLLHLESPPPPCLQPRAPSSRWWVPARLQLSHSPRSLRQRRATLVPPPQRPPLPRSLLSQWKCALPPTLLLPHQTPPCTWPSARTRR